MFVDVVPGLTNVTSGTLAGVLYRKTRQESYPLMELCAACKNLRRPRTQCIFFSLPSFLPFVYLPLKPLDYSHHCSIQMGMRSLFPSLRLSNRLGNTDNTLLTLLFLKEKHISVHIDAFPFRQGSVQVFPLPAGTATILGGVINWP